jgi:thioredoxin reductase
VAAHLTAAGVRNQVVGDAMEFWRRSMPKGMYLRSSWDASSISDPAGAVSLDRYQAVTGKRLSRPIPLDDFLEYGRWFQRSAVPNLLTNRVHQIAQEGQIFRVALDDTNVIHASRVVLATGLSGFAHRPKTFVDVEPRHISHSSEHCDLSRFKGQQVVVIGGGQSAVEVSALLGEAGAETELICRAPSIRWLTRSGWLHGNLGPLLPLAYPWTDVGPPGLNHIVAHPEIFRRLPLSVQPWVAYNSIRPAASAWLTNRVTNVRITTRRHVTRAIPSDHGVTLLLDDSSKRQVNHVILATGYKVDVRQHPLLEPGLGAQIRTTDGYPVLRNGLESSVDGLHFAGAAAALEFGPIMRFVSGTRYAASSIARQITANQ